MLASVKMYQCSPERNITHKEENSGLVVSDQYQNPYKELSIFYNN